MAKVVGQVEKEAGAGLAHTPPCRPTSTIHPELGIRRQAEPRTLLPGAPGATARRSIGWAGGARGLRRSQRQSAEPATRARNQPRASASPPPRRTPSPRPREDDQPSPPRPWLTRSQRRVQLPPAGQRTIVPYNAEIAVAKSVRSPNQGGRSSSRAGGSPGSADGARAAAGGAAFSGVSPGGSSAPGAERPRPHVETSARRPALRANLRPPTPPVQRDRSPAAPDRAARRSPSPDSPSSGKGSGKGKKGGKGKNKGKNKGKSKGKRKGKGKSKAGK